MIGWNAGYPLYQYQGFWCSPNFIEDIILAQEGFRAEPTDIFVCSASKSGTTWLKALTFAIVTRTRYDTSTSPLLSKVSHDCIPTEPKDAFVSLYHFLAKRAPNKDDYLSLEKAFDLSCESKSMDPIWTMKTRFCSSNMKK
ncbi:flavonol sulfotransferase-like [Gossypium hirsutum]|uniref:Sulfotransferase n=1 Tax=Gossypium hirsutum TaxID=3635 RepID=A0ABM2YNM9_GOSHI|nr:flavonol sulfotransferase-like [Gossypium hirsutum]